jgi:hypothetical protein
MILEYRVTLKRFLFWYRIVPVGERFWIDDDGFFEMSL